MGAADEVVGRARELTELQRWYDEALAGNGRLALIVGEPGIGKTRLVEEFVRYAETAGVPVAWGHAVDDVTAPALRPWRRLLRQVPGGDAIDVPPTEWFAFADAVTDVLTSVAASDGAVFVLEDLQWADSASLRLLRHVARELGRSRVLLIGTYRDVRTETTTPLTEMLPALLREPRVEVVRPGLLARGDVDQVLRAFVDGHVDPAYADVVHQRTGGNPLYVRTLARLLATEGDMSQYDESRVATVVTRRPELRQLVLALLQTLQREHRDVLEAASVLGERIDVDLLATVTGTDVQSALQASAVAGVLVDRDGWRFTHALLRDGVYADVHPSRRTSLHQKAAQVLTDRSGDSAVIAGHWSRAGDPASAATTADWARRAGREALAASAYDEAVRWAGLALDGLEQSGASDSDCAEVLVELATAEFAGGFVRRAMDDAIAAADRAATNSRLLAAAALVVQGIGEAGIARDAETLCERALAVQTDADPAVRARLLAQLTCMTPDSRSEDERTAWSGEALRLAEVADDADALFESLRARQMVMCAPQHVEERIGLGHRAVELGQRGATVASMWGHIWLVEAAFQVGDMASIERELAALATIAERLQSPLAHWHHARLSAARSALVGDFDDALEFSERARALAIRMEDRTAIAFSYALRLRVALDRGDPSTVDDEVTLALRHAPQMVIVATNRVLLQRLRGDLDGAAADYAALRGGASTVPMNGGWLPGLTNLTQLAVIYEDREQAEVLYELLAPLAAYNGTGTIGTVYCSGSLALHLGMLAALLGRKDTAEQHLRAAVAANDRLGAQPVAALARMRLAEVVAESAPAVGLGLANYAARTLRRFEMPGPLAECEAVIAQLQQAEASTGRLTRREREVALLVADGLSNKDIAARLVLSERTVESHVASILTKLDCTSRTQIATWALRELPIPN